MLEGIQKAAKQTAMAATVGLGLMGGEVAAQTAPAMSPEQHVQSIEKDVAELHILIPQLIKQLELQLVELQKNPDQNLLAIIDTRNTIAARNIDLVIARSQLELTKIRVRTGIFKE